MEEAILVGIGGAIGSVFRFRLSQLQPIRGIPAGTALVNISGSFACALIVFSAAESSLIAFICTGILGGFTTFSTFSFETFRMLEDHDYHAAIGNILINAAGSLLGALAGYLLAAGFM